MYAQKPYYSAYPAQTNATQSRYFSWTEAMPDASQQPVLEWITAPNNPDATFRNKTVAGQPSVRSTRITALTATALQRELLKASPYLV